MRAIISVYDKTGVIDFARGLTEAGYEIFSTGNTKKTIADAKVPVHSISDITGFPEILDGRVKTLHPIVIVGPADYPLVLEKIRKGGLNMNERKRLAQKAFQHVAVYDTAIAQYLARVISSNQNSR